MAMKKTYRAHSILCIEVGGRRVTFSGSRNTYSTENESEIAELDRLVELDYIELDEVEDGGLGELDPPIVPEADEEGNVFPDVVKVSEAKAILMEEPYNVPLDDMKNKPAILSIAANLGVSFPNLK